MTEKQFKQFVQEFAEREKHDYADLVLYSFAETQKELIIKETNAAIYRYIAELPNRLWSYIETKLPKD